jgi:ribose 5-phosphate isomerase A
MTQDSLQSLKQQAADHAVNAVESGMVLGLGSGSTATLAIRRIGELLRAGTLRDIVGVPTSSVIAAEAQAAGIPLTTLDEHPTLDLTIDGADEVDPALNLIKGGGAALLREKVVAQATVREIIIVDESKLSPQLGMKWAVPIEVITFGCQAQMRFLESLEGRPVLRTLPNGEPLLTDHGNYIVDTDFGAIDDLAALTRALEGRAGIVEHGIFMNLASEVIVAGASGVRRVTRPAQI